ncbi:alpha/beta hydrolase [Marinicrinis sediminis]|uniref:Alpha/beta hydrolase n=1 Tax=Marinicrinis sediminis TaxID=1652465 RepID=A0ABW5RHX9_9BACL
MQIPLSIPYQQLELAATLHLPGDLAQPGVSTPLVLICHGFTGSRIGANRLFVHGARALQKKGYAVLRFDYAGCGESTGDYGAEGLQSMVQQTKAVLDYARHSLDSFTPSEIILLGHSLGGATAVLTAVTEPQIDKLILWAPVAHPYQDIMEIVGKPQVEQALRDGSVPYLSYRLQERFFHSLQQCQPLFDAQRVQGDALILHGSSDDVIPTDYCFLYDKVLKLRNAGTVSKEVLFQADHTFSRLEHQEQLFELTLAWLARMDRRQDWQGWNI